MTTRREFIKQATTATCMLSAITGSTSASAASVLSSAKTAEEDRAYWCAMASRLATPILTALAERRLKASMPVEAHDPRARGEYTHLEALGRLLCGIAPWLELAADATPEGAARARFAELAREGIDAATDPASPDFMNFSREWQPLVDAAFLAQAMLRAPRELWQRLPARVQSNVVAALQSSRPIIPPESNWKLFASEIEAFFQQTGHPVDRERLLDGVRKFERWYLGDGTYGDGPEFHWDYYNSFVIHPMLLETLDVVAKHADEWQTFRGKVRERLTRFAAIEERLIAPDGTYPIVGRSIAYRCGAFQALALAAWRQLLPRAVTPPQARVALTRVIRRTLEPAGTWDDHGWLRIGVSGHQPEIGEPYISTGSLYLCSTALLPLGLPPTEPFWSGPAEPTTNEKVWAGRDIPADHSLSERQ